MDTSILILSLNAETVDPESLRGALQETMRADRKAWPGTHEKYVVLCLQESLQTQQSLWADLLLEFGLVAIGLPSSLPTQAPQAKKTVVQVYAASNCHDVSLQSSVFRTHPTKESSNKGGVVSVLSWKDRDFRIGLGSFHLDGKLKESKRISAVEAALGSLPADTLVLFAGDFNFTMDPLRTLGWVGPDMGAVGSCMSQIASQIGVLRAEGAEDALEQLEPSALTAFEEVIGTPESRTMLHQVVDSNPKQVNASENSGHLELQELPAGAFPTYRICGGAIPSSDSFRALRRKESLSREEVHQCFFSDDTENKSGRLKKRKDVVRLQCGWNDRLYAGTVGSSTPSSSSSSKRSSNSSSNPSSNLSGAGALPNMRIVAHDPLLLKRVDGSVVDHALVCWSCGIPSTA
jgi:hypothetical protein